MSDTIKETKNTSKESSEKDTSQVLPEKDTSQVLPEKDTFQVLQNISEESPKTNTLIKLPETNTFSGDVLIQEEPSRNSGAYDVYKTIGDTLHTPTIPKYVLSGERVLESYAKNNGDDKSDTWVDRLAALGNDHSMPRHHKFYERNTIIEASKNESNTNKVQQSVIKNTIDGDYRTTSTPSATSLTPSATSLTPSATSSTTTIATTRGSIHDYKKIISYASSVTSRQLTIEKLLVNSSRIGIIRNVRALLPVAIGNGYIKAIKDAYDMALKYAHLDVMCLLDIPEIKVNIEESLIKAITYGWCDIINYYVLEKKANMTNRKDLLPYACLETDNMDILRMILNNLDEKNKLTDHEIQNLIDLCINNKSDNCARFLIQMPSASVPSKPKPVEVPVSPTYYFTYFTDDEDQIADYNYANDEDQIADYNYADDHTDDHTNVSFSRKDSAPTNTIVLTDDCDGYNYGGNNYDETNYDENNDDFLEPNDFI